MKQPSLLMLFFLLFVLAGAETNELLRLTDNTANDYGTSTSQKESVCKNSAGQQPASLPESASVPISLGSRSSFDVGPLSRSTPAATLRVLYSILRT